MANEYVDSESENDLEHKGVAERRKDYRRRTHTDRGRSAGRTVHKSAGGIHRRRRKSYGL